MTTPQPAPIWTTAEEALAPMPGESGPANTALIDYAYLGEGRSMRALHTRYVDESAAGVRVPTVRLRTLEQWSGKFAWRARAAVVDQAARNKRILDRQVEQEAMQKRHRQMAQAMQTKVLEWLKLADNTLRRPADVAAFLKLAVDIERRSYGVPTALLELTVLSDAQLRDRHAQTLNAIRAAMGALPEEERDEMSRALGLPEDDDDEDALP